MIRIQIGSAGLALPKTVTVTTADEEPGSEPPAGQETSEEKAAAADSTDSTGSPATVETQSAETPPSPQKPGSGSRRARKSFR